jgi:circadian clock protein KaiB
MIDLRDPEAPSNGQPLHLRLYVVRPGPNSLRAIENLSELRRDEGGDEWQVDIVDVADNPEEALRDGVLVSPTLVRIIPLPVIKIIGDLSDKRTVAAALRQI